MTRRNLVALAVSVLLLVLFTSQTVTAMCSDPPCEMNIPRYDQILAAEPDNWCLYQFGDRAFTNYPTGEWYVVRYDNPDQMQIASEFAQEGWAVDQYVVDCQLYTFP